MSTTRLENEPILLSGAASDAAPGGAARPRWVRLRDWWRKETARIIEDEAMERDDMAGRPIRMVLPVVLPVLAVAAVVMLREPDNVVALTCLALGAVAITYGVLADWIEQRVAGSWVPLMNTAVYALMISLELWFFLTIDHPRLHLHWVIFFLYFLLIGASGLSDDPRQPVAAGIYSIAGYAIVVSLFLNTAAAGTSPMAVAIAPEFEWVGNAAKIGLLAAATFTGAASARRGRAVRRLSLRDGLTGLLNRRAFDRCLAHLAQRAERTGDPLTIAMIDIDRFKQLNDTHGHPSGDAVLRWAAESLTRNFRATDLICRYGGDEFVVAFVDSDNLAVLVSRLECLREEIEQAWLRTSGGESIDVTVSIGIAQAPRDGSVFENVLSRADERLYEAKHAGRNRIEFGTIS